MKAFGFNRAAASNKALAMPLVIKELVARGYKVGVVQACATENTDAANWALTDEECGYREAGATLLAVSTPDATSILYRESLDIRRTLAFFAGYDYVLCEDAQGYVMPIIVVCDSGQEPDKLAICVSVEQDIKAVADLIEEKVFTLLPNAENGHCGKCGADCHTMAERILRGEAKRGDCGGNAGVELAMNGMRIDMQPFMERMLRKTLLGMLSEYKGYVEGGEVSITIR